MLSYMMLKKVVTGQKCQHFLVVSQKVKLKRNYRQTSLMRFVAG